MRKYGSKKLARMWHGHGWRDESERHSLAARRVRTGRKPAAVYSGKKLVGDFNIAGFKTLKASGKMNCIYCGYEGVPSTEGFGLQRCPRCGEDIEIKDKRFLKAGGFSAGTVLEQLGGNKFIAMTGANSFVKDDERQQIAFKIGRNSMGVNWVRVTLTPADTYDVEFMAVRSGVVKVKSKAEGVFNDQLQEVFTEHTGMHTKLFAKGSFPDTVVMRKKGDVKVLDSERERDSIDMLRKKGYKVCWKESERRAPRYMMKKDW